jgi:FMN phosphatase YigB (HAD superfamily)
MGVISDFDERLEGIMTDLGVRSYFKFVVQSYVEGYSKPSKELWTAVVRKANVSNAWHVGDDIEKDAFSDATSILIDRNSGTPGPNKIASLIELSTFLNI